MTWRDEQDDGGGGGVVVGEGGGGAMRMHLDTSMCVCLMTDCTLPRLPEIPRLMTRLSRLSRPPADTTAKLLRLQANEEYNV